jgi:hypothetical protein
VYVSLQLYESLWAVFKEVALVRKSKMLYLIKKGISNIAGNSLHIYKTIVYSQPEKPYGQAPMDRLMDGRMDGCRKTDK